MKFFSLLLLLFVTSALLLGGVMYENDIEENATTDISNITSAISWENTNVSAVDLGNSTYMTSLSGMINRGVDFAGYSLLEAIKLGMEFGYNHPEYGYDAFFGLVWLALIATILAALAPLLIPFLALVTILVMGIKSLAMLIMNIYKGGRKK